MSQSSRPATSSTFSTASNWGVTGRSLCDKMLLVVANERHEPLPAANATETGKGDANGPKPLFAGTQLCPGRLRWSVLFDGVVTFGSTT
jgi:hypothetical protein